MGADLWTRKQKADKQAARASGVRVDVPHPPTWMRVSFFSSTCLEAAGMRQIRHCHP